MKTNTLYFLLFVVIIFSIRNVKAQTDENIKVVNPFLNKNIVIKTNPFASLASGIWGGVWFDFIPLTAELPRLGIEVGSGHHAVMISGGYLGWSPVGYIPFNESETFRDVITNKGIKIQGLYKYYIAGEAPSGLYIGPYFSYSATKFVNKEDPNDYLKARAQIFSFAFGHQFISEGGFSFDIFIGIGYKNKNWQPSNIAEIDDDLGIFNDEVNLKIPFVMNFGYAF